MALAFQLPLGVEAKWRLLYGSFLLGLLPLCASCLWDKYAYACFEDVLSIWFGLFFGLVHVPGSSAGRRGSWRCTVVLCGLITFLSTFLVGYPCVLWAFPYLRLHEDQDVFVFVPDQQTLAFVLLSLIWVCCMMREHPLSTCTHDAKWCMLAFWLAGASWQAGYICLDNNWDIALARHVQQFGCGLQGVALGWSLHLLQMRILGIRSSLQQSSWSTFGSRLLILVMCGSWLIRQMSFFLAEPSLDGGGPWKVRPFVVSLSVLCGVWVVYAARICRILSLKLGLLLQETRRVRGPPRRQAIWAAKVVGVETLICAILGLAMCFHGVVSGIVVYSHARLLSAWSDANYQLFKTWAELMLGLTNTMWVVNSLGLGLLSGILWQVHPPKDDPQSAGELTRGLVSMSSFLSPREKEMYDQVVKQLANRCVSLEALLSFWERLRDGQTMPGFDPRRSLTNDVVRRAIIPESRVGDGGCALASLWSGTDMKPQVMVTHNWTNGFGSLTAAIAADALGRAGYQEVSAQIATPSGIEQVRAKLAGKLETTYWVCAFCINQHASICGGFGPEPPQGTPEWAAWNRRRYDSVTGEAFVLCNCQVEKVFSHTDARCELNKFDDMMTHLAQQVGPFAQLIVVDDAFDVLYRAWCVAEIFEANVLGMESRIQVSSQDAVDQNYDRLSLLDVRQCTASSQADKEMIMAKISDVEVFNWKIQQLIFSEEMGLFVQWVEGNERSRQVGRIVRRCEARAQGTKDEPARRSRGCFASLRMLTSPDRDSDESSEEALAAETWDSSSSAS